VAASLRGGRSRCPAGRQLEAAHEPASVGPRSWARSCTCARPTTSGRTKSRCTSSGTTTSALSPSGIWRILKRLALSRLPASQRYRRHNDRWKRYERPQPGSRVQIDVKFIAPLPGSRRKHYQYTAINDCTRLRVLRAYPRCNQATSIRFLDEVLARLPFRVETVQTDNGAESVELSLTRARPGIGHVYIKPATPRLNGKVERSHRIDADEFHKLLDGLVIDESGLFAERLREWEDYYNFDRPHGALGGRTPYERLRQKTGAAV